MSPAFVGRAEAARILRVTEDQVVALSRAGHLGQVRRGQEPPEDVKEYRRRTRFDI